MLSQQQRVSFMTLCQRAWSNVSPGTPFDAWRHAELVSIGLPASTKSMDHVWDYERAMLHLATLADDYGQMIYWGDCAKRRLSWIFGGFRADLEYLRGKAASTDYLEELLERSHLGETGQLSKEDMRSACAMVDSEIRRLSSRLGVDLSNLPTAGRPWCFRGAKAARFQAFITGAKAS